MDTDTEKDRNKRWLIRVVLALGTVAAFGSVVGHEFVNFDDRDYVAGNPHLAGGFSAAKIAWAFTSTAYASNWHPLTWLSLMADHAIFGPHPGGYHFTNLLLHLANTLLLFEVLRRLTGATWRSGLVAALFAWHPLHVESVAWVSERKDVLSAFFWLLTLWAYAGYARAVATAGRARPPSLLRAIAQNRQSQLYYALTFIGFALALLSKPMVVTLPCVLLLLDYWPLGRMAEPGSEKAQAEAWPLAWLVLEKAPLFLLAAGTCALTMMAEKAGGSMTVLNGLTPGQRIANALISYVRHLGKTVWPIELAAFYPYPAAWPAWQVIAAAVFLLAITVAFFWVRRRRPYLLVGWLWFLGTLVPVIGLVQVGLQSMADRHTYLPLIGVFVMVVWGAGDLAALRPHFAPALRVGAAIVLLGLLGCTFVQARYWRDSMTLFTHAQRVTGSNYVVEDQLGMALEELGRTGEALPHFEAALKLAPDYPLTSYCLGLIYAKQGRTQSALESFETALRGWPNFDVAHYNLARVLAGLGRLDEAVAHYTACLRTCTEPTDVHYNLANALVALGKLAEAVEHYRASLRTGPDSASARNNLGVVLLRLGDPAAAVSEFEAALRLQPDSAETQDQLGGALQKLGQGATAEQHFAEAVRLKPDLVHPRLKLGLLLAQQGRFDEAKIHLARAVELDPTNDVALYNLAGVQAAQGRFAEAAVSLSAALRLRPNAPDIHSRLAAVLAEQGDVEPAIRHYREAIRLQPNGVDALRGLADILATCPQPQWRNGAEAVQLAERACEAVNRRDPHLLATLDAAYAEAGRFDEASKTAQEAQTLAVLAKQTTLAEDAGKRLELYRSGKAYHRPLVR